jgi:ubiquinone/menaquinone biosynthesis C-methylase UbiE
MTMPSSKKQLRTEELYWRAPTRELLGRCHKEPSQAVLDAGFGSGHSTVWLELATDAARIDCLDVSTAGAAGVVRTLARHFSKVNFRPVRGMVEALPYDNNRFDIIFCRVVVNGANLETAITAMTGALKPDGKLFIVVELGGNPFVNRWKRFDPKAADYASLDALKKNGVIRSHVEFHLLTPLLFKLFFRLPARVARPLLSLARFVESLPISQISSLRKYCWFSFIEVVK